MGRSQKQIYEYDLEGKLIKTYESQNEFRKFYFPEDKGVRPIFTKKIIGYEFRITPINTIAMSERPYRDNVRFLYRVYKSELCNFKNTLQSNKPIQMFNLKNELIAEFKSLSVAKYLLKEDFRLGTIYSQLNTRKGIGNYDLENDYYFKYKD